MAHATGYGTVREEGVQRMNKGYENVVSIDTDWWPRVVMSLLDESRPYGGAAYALATNACLCEVTEDYVILIAEEGDIPLITYSVMARIHKQIIKILNRPIKVAWMFFPPEGYLIAESQEQPA